MSIEANLKKVPTWKVSDYNRWADYIELNCIFNKDKIISKDDFFQIKFPDIESGDEEHSAEYDRLMGYIDDYYRLLKYRNSSLDSFYPFELDEDDCLIFKSDLNEDHIYYLYFLIASNTGFVTKSDMNKLTLLFEEVCVKFLEILQPAHSNNFIFGTSRENSIFTGNLRSRIVQLAELLNADTHKEFDKDDQYDRARGGDNGIDLVSIFDLDNSPFIPFALAQCSCSYDQWKLKQESISEDKWRKRLCEITTFIKYMFVPFDCRLASGKFENPTDIHTVLIDRQRLKILIDRCRVNNVDLHEIKEVVTDLYGFA